MAGRIRIGCAGWSILSRHRALFGTEGSHLARYASRFDAVEINSSFYRSHATATYARWAEQVPAAFRFSVKVPKAITHEAALRGCGPPLTRFAGEVAGLGRKLGGVLVQLPPSLVFDDSVVRPFFERLRENYDGPLACEPRHASWFTGSVDRALRELDVSRVAADPARVPRAALPGGDRHRIYLRLHGSPRTYYDAYASPVLERVARRLRRAPLGWCIFDNTVLGHATGNAIELQRMLRSP